MAGELLLLGLLMGWDGLSVGLYSLLGSLLRLRLNLLRCRLRHRLGRCGTGLILLEERAEETILLGCCRDHVDLSVVCASEGLATEMHSK
jgi:hypothetical protein